MDKILGSQSHGLYCYFNIIFAYVNNYVVLIISQFQSYAI